MGARVREVVDQTYLPATIPRYHFVAKPPPLRPPIGTTLPLAYPTSSMLRIHSAVIRLYQPLIPSCDRVAAVNNPLTA